MRIGIDIKTLKNRPSGIQIYLINLLDALQTLDTTNDYILYEQKPSTYHIFNPRWSKVVVPSRLPGTLWLQLFIPFRIRKDRIDLFWGPEQVCPLWKLSRVKYITTIHDFTFKHFPQTVRRSTRVILSLTWRRVFAISDTLLPVSDKMNKETCRLIKRKNHPTQLIETITNGAPDWPIPPEYAPENRGNFLLFVGNIEPRKNLVRLIEALELLHTRGVTVPLKIISSGAWQRGEFAQKLETSPVRGNIELCGYLPTEALRNELLSCKALVFPSLYEGFGIPVLEALALDCLVLTSSGTAMEDVAGGCACYFDPLSSMDMAQCIEEIYQPAFDRTVHLKHRSMVLSQYTWNNSAHRLIALWERLFSR